MPNHTAIEHFLKSMPNPKPTLLVIVSYENPATLQLMLESGALAVIDRPVKPFGILANLAIARSVWLEQQENLKELRKFKRKAAGDRKLVRAKTILMASKGITEDQAHQYIRQQAMTKRLPMEDIANAIIHAEDLLRS